MLYVTWFDIKRLPLFRMMLNRETQIEQAEKPRPAPATQTPPVRHALLSFPLPLFARQTREVVVGDPARGGVIIGGDHPVVVQSMITCDTMDTAECVKQTLDLVAVGCQTRPHHRPHRQGRRQFEQHCRRVARAVVAPCRLSPTSISNPKPRWRRPSGSRWFASIPAITPIQEEFAVKEYRDAQYAAELARIEEKFTPLVRRCRELGRALRIGTNHGSLSDRIMNRFGDTPLGMVESALEFARIARNHDFHNFKFSMKSSNPKVMIECYRLLVARLETGARTGIIQSTSG